MSGSFNPYNANWNGTNRAGWFISFNDYFNAGKTSYITFCCNLKVTTTFQWFWRLFINETAGYPSFLVTSIIDFRNPTSGSNVLNVTTTFDANGNGAIWISQIIANTTEMLEFKMYG